MPATKPTTVQIMIPIATHIQGITNPVPNTILNIFPTNTPKIIPNMAPKILIKILANKNQVDAIICLGCLIKGDTAHDEYIANAVANGLTQIGVMFDIPCIFGVLTVLNEQQAIDRSGGKYGNKGVEAAVTAIRMAALKRLM